MNEPLTHETLSSEAEAAIYAFIDPLFEIDYEAIAASTAPDQPGGRIAFSTANYATDEEADAALEAFFTSIIEAPYEKA